MLPKMCIVNTHTQRERERERERESERETLVFVTFNIVISHVFHETFIEIPQVVQKICSLVSSMLIVFINFQRFLVPKELMTPSYNKLYQHCFTSIPSKQVV